MLVTIIRVIFIIIGGLAGYQGVAYSVRAGFSFGLGVPDPRYLALGAGLGGLVGLFVGPIAIKWCTRSMTRLIATLQGTPTQDIITGAIGLVSGLLIAILATLPLPRQIPIIGDFLPVLITLAAGYTGMVVAVKKKEDLLNVFSFVPKSVERVVPSKDRPARTRVTGKILDTSVIIDGRIADIINSGFVEGGLIIPAFVLEELQHIADSSDVLRRNRGRRGLDILNKMQKESDVTIQILEKDFEDISEVDSKLVKLARELHAKVITNDYNLNKVAELQGVDVLNINELANAVKPIVLPGEEMHVQVIKDGKEHGQGVGYLDDGTMIVVDGGRKYIGESIGVMVTSVLQTSAGRMIFAKPKSVERAL